LSAFVINSLTMSSASGSGDNCVEVAALPEGGFGVRDSKDANGPVLGFTAHEWHAFVRGVKGAGQAAG
jgi:Domain of unknown function (DUF397)